MAWREKIKNFWDKRTTREQKILLWWMGGLACFLLYFLAVEPITKRIERLQKTLPDLEATLLSMRSDFAVGQQSVATQVKYTNLRSALFQFLEKHNISGDLRFPETDRAQLRLPEMDITQALDMLQKLRLEVAGRITMLSIKRGRNNGQALIVVEVQRTP